MNLNLNLNPSDCLHIVFFHMTLTCKEADTPSPQVASTVSTDSVCHKVYTRLTQATDFFKNISFYPFVSQIRYISQTQGLPAEYLLSAGTKTSRFFNRGPDSSYPLWRLKVSDSTEKHTNMAERFCHDGTYSTCTEALLRLFSFRRLQSTRQRWASSRRRRENTSSTVSMI